jgi:hypothetical protein
MFFNLSDAVKSWGGTVRLAGYGGNDPGEPVTIFRPVSPPGRIHWLGLDAKNEPFGKRRAIVHPIRAFGGTTNCMIGLADVEEFI